jgi:hypothetical protein
VIRSDDRRLDDIVEVTAEIADIVGLGGDGFDADVTLRHGLEPRLEIVGEAVVDR